MGARLLNHVVFGKLISKSAKSVLHTKSALRDGVIVARSAALPPLLIEAKLRALSQQVVSLFLSVCVA